MARPTPLTVEDRLMIGELLVRLGRCLDDRDPDG
jgi:hypothetical protein